MRYLLKNGSRDQDLNERCFDPGKWSPRLLVTLTGSGVRLRDDVSYLLAQTLQTALPIPDGIAENNKRPGRRADNDSKYTY